MSQTYLVTGASGQLGRAVLERLLELKPGTLVAASRTPEKLSEFAAKGVETRTADFDEPAGLEAAFAGADRLLLISTDALDEPGKRQRQQIAAVEAAKKAGVKHIVYTSMINPEHSPVTIAPDHEETEKAIQASGMDYTILRMSLYMDLFLMTLPRAVATGQLIAAAGDGGVGYITRADCALAAAGALAADFNGKRTLDVTGPELLTQTDVARRTAELTGTSIEYVSIPAADLKQGMVQAGLPEPLAGVFVSFDVAVSEGKLAVVSNVVQELSGQRPTALEQFLKAHREALLDSVAG